MNEEIKIADPLKTNAAIIFREISGDVVLMQRDTAQRETLMLYLSPEQAVKLAKKILDKYDSKNT